MNRSHIFAHCIFNPHYSVFLVVCLTNMFHILCPVPLHNKYSIGILINIKQSLNSDLHFATKLPFVSLLWYVLFCRRVLFQTFFDSIARMLNMILYYKTKKIDIFIYEDYEIIQTQSILTSQINKVHENIKCCCPMYIPSNDDKINNYLTICILSDTD